MKRLVELYNDIVQWLTKIDGIAPVLIRLFLASVMVPAGWRKFDNFDNTARWFGDSLGLPFPELMTFLAASAELVGGICLLIGLATRFAAIPLMVTMVVAAVTTHLPNGWHVLSDSSSWWANERIEQAAPLKREIRSILREHGDYARLTSKGSVTILNNGIEFAAIYFIMLLSLLFTGGGRYTSLDYWIGRRLIPH